ncbi:MAG: hypothetical protein IJ379_12275 [Lachnospiraceae bacterium]|nr:hypothetical protein [Lachnospiraceae bacterium]
MSREEAIRIIASRDFANCSEKDRELIIYNSWGLEESDEMFHLLPNDLREELINFDEPQEDIMSSKYDMLVVIMCEIAYDLYSNEKLAVIVSNILGSLISVEGDEPIRYGCPCCKKELLPTRGEYDICSNCGWEDDGNEQDDRYSYPNRMTLAQGRENYRMFGICKGRDEI